MDIIIFGVGSQAELAHYFFTHDSDYQVVAFCIDAAYLTLSPTTFCHLPVVNATDLPVLFPSQHYRLHVALGRNDLRAKVFGQFKELGYSFASYISSKGIRFADLVAGENVFIDASTQVHPFVKIGDNTILVGALIGHHATLGSHMLASCAHVGAKSIIGDYSYLGINCVVREGISIGSHNLIGAAAYIGVSTENYAVYSAPRSTKRAVRSDRVSFFS